MPRRFRGVLSCVLPCSSTTGSSLKLPCCGCDGDDASDDNPYDDDGDDDDEPFDDYGRGEDEDDPYGNDDVEEVVDMI